jgi:hypothetical protein
MTAPCVIAQPLPEAERLLRQAGVEVSILHTSPPGNAPSGPLRVIAQRNLPTGVGIVVAASIQLAEDQHVRD